MTSIRLCMRGRHSASLNTNFSKRAKGTGSGSRRFFKKLLLNFTWWVNRKDAESNNLFQGGFLGLDNIGLFDRNMKLPAGYLLEQSDGTSWMATFCVRMLAIALGLSRLNPVYQGMANQVLWSTRS